VTLQLRQSNLGKLGLGLNSSYHVSDRLGVIECFLLGMGLTTIDENSRDQLVV